MRKRTSRMVRSAYKKRTYSKKRSGFAARVTRVVRNLAEPKTKRFMLAKYELYHNAYGPGAGSQGLRLGINDAAVMPIQGIAPNQRIGDMIYFTGWRIKLLIGQKFDRPNVTFRYSVILAPKNGNIAYGDFFVATTSNVLLDDHNTEYIKVLKTGYWRPNQAALASAGGREYTFTKSMYIPHRRLVKFGPALGANTHNDYDAFLVIMAYDAFGSLNTDNIAYVQGCIDIEYRDP